MTKTCHFAVQTINYQAFSCLSIYAVKIPIEREFFTRECLYACQPIKISAKTIELSAYQIHNNRQFFVYFFARLCLCSCLFVCVYVWMTKTEQKQKKIKSFDYIMPIRRRWFERTSNTILWISNVKRIIQV